MFVPVTTVSTTDTSCYFLLESGLYRSRVSPINVFGKKSASSSWAEFIVLGSSQPFILRESFPVNERYGTRALVRSCGNDRGTEIITLQGYNCFFDDTEFSLVPLSKTVVNGRQYAGPGTVYSSDAGGIKLTVAARREDRNEIDLTVDWSRLNAGSYMLQVTNSAEHGAYDDDILFDEQEILVLPRRIPYTASLNLEYDELLEAYVLPITPDDSVSIQAEGLSDSQFDTFSYLEPVPASEKAYPFADSTIGDTVSLAVSENRGSSWGTTFSAASGTLRTGYYNLVQETPGVGKSVHTVLVDVSFPEEEALRFEKVTGKYTNSSQTVAFTVKMNRPIFQDVASGVSSASESGIKLFLVLQSDIYGENRRILLRMGTAEKDGFIATFETPASSLSTGVYALLMEVEGTGEKTFVEISSSFGIKQKTMTEQQVTDLFLTPPSEEALALKAAQDAELAQTMLETGLKLPVSLTGFGEQGTWISYVDGPVALSNFAPSGNMVRLDVVNYVPEIPYESTYRFTDEETLEQVRESEGITFLNRVTARNNGKTEWSVVIMHGNVQTDIPLYSGNGLSQTVVKFEDYGITASEVKEIRFVAHVTAPKEEGWHNTLEVYDPKTYSSLDPIPDPVYVKPVWFTKVGMYGGIKLDGSSIDVDKMKYSDLYLRVVDRGWISFDLSLYGSEVGPCIGTSDGIELYLTSMTAGVRFAYPNAYIEPFAGISFGAGDGWLFPMYAGVKIFDFLNIRWSFVPYIEYTSGRFEYDPQQQGASGSLSSNSLLVGFNSLLNTEFKSQQWLSVGVELPLRKQRPIISNTFEAAVAAEEKKTPVFFTSLSMDSYIGAIDLISCSDWEYESLFGLTLRILELRHLSLDASAAIGNDIVASSVLNFTLPSNDSKVSLSFGAGIGWDALIGLVIPQELRLKVGDYFSIALQGQLPYESMDSVIEDMTNTWYLAPIIPFMHSRAFGVSFSVHVPLRK